GVTSSLALSLLFALVTGGAGAAASAAAKAPIFIKAINKIKEIIELIKKVKLHRKQRKGHNTKIAESDDKPKKDKLKEKEKKECKDNGCGDDANTSIRTPRDQAVADVYAEAQARGVEIRTGQEADEWLDYAARQQGIAPESMHATTLGDDLIYIRDAHSSNPRVLREELVHTTQNSRITVGADPSVDTRPALEIEAREELIRNRHQWSITNDEIREAIQEIRIIRETGQY
ncbi:hypothetical protein MNBD_GAMMA10-1654, partial [hydrothermal vent metagenome]